MPKAEQCKVCGENSILSVATNNGVEFFSCCNEDCSEYAEMLVETMEGFIYAAEMLNKFKDVVKEITNERNKVSGS